jgi:aerobic carbon-monoxide dehydrogenase medium subunit
LSRVTHAQSLAEATELLARLGNDASPLAAGTWIMRDWQRGEKRRQHFVALDQIAELHAIEIGEETRIGALATHDELARVIDNPALAAIAEAARTSAFPAIRSTATVGGNICAEPFPEADLVPALLACGADAAIAESAGKQRREPLAALLERRPRLPPGAVLEQVLVRAPAGRISTFRRLTVRGGGEYAVASVALSVDLDEAALVRAARVAIGSVEEQPRLVPEAAAALVGAPLDSSCGRAAGEAAAANCEPRDGLDAPAWYRRAVLPVLVVDAVSALGVA